MNVKAFASFCFNFFGQILYHLENDLHFFTLRFFVNVLYFFFTGEHGDPMVGSSNCNQSGEMWRIQTNKV